MLCVIITMTNSFTYLFIHLFIWGRGMVGTAHMCSGDNLEKSVFFPHGSLRDWTQIVSLDSKHFTCLDVILTLVLVFEGILLVYVWSEKESLEERPGRSLCLPWVPRIALQWVLLRMLSPESASCTPTRSGSSGSTSSQAVSWDKSLPSELKVLGFYGNRTGI